MFIFNNYLYATTQGDAMSKKVHSVIGNAQKYAAMTKNHANLMVLLGQIPGDSINSIKFTRSAAAVDHESSIDRGQRIFDKFKKYLKQAVCDDFKYCQKRETVKKNLDKYLPTIVKMLLKRIPIAKSTPSWLVKILSPLGIASISIEAIVAILIAWLLVEGCDALCGCDDESCKVNVQERS
jgi:hypothetical protein